MAQLLLEKGEGKRSEKRNSFVRIDGLERVTGAAKYGGDWKMPEMLYARIIQSSIPHGTVKTIDATKALSMEGVKGIITCLDDSTIWNPGERLHKRRVLADRVRFVGDCIGAIAATSRKIAQEAVESVQVTYDELPAVFDPMQAMKPDSPKIWDDGNLIGPLKYGFGDSSVSFAKAERIFERKYVTSRVQNAQLEPAVSLAWWDEYQRKLTVVAATQGLSTCRESMAEDLGLSIENVRIISLYKGGGFGNKNRSMNYDLIAALLGKKTRRPVMVEYSREQEFMGVHGRWSSIQNIRAAVKGAKILGVELKGYCDAGAYARHIKQGNFLDGPEGYYSCESWNAEVYGIYTNTPATGHMRAPTGPQSCFASETLTDEIANELSIDPLEFRLENAIEKHHGTEELVSNSMKECLKLGAEKFGWKQRWKRNNNNDWKTAQGKNSGKMRGVGLAMTSWHSLLGKGEALLKLKSDGMLEVYVGVVDIGTGAKTTMAAIAANEFGVPIDNVKLIWGDTDICPYSIGESGSRTTGFTGTAVKVAAVKLKEKVILLASEYYKVSPRELVIMDGYISRTAGELRVALDEFLKSQNIDELVERQISEPTLPEHKARYAFAAHFAEVEVDVETGIINVSKYLACHESGEIVNLLTAESQVQGSIVMGMGIALSEKILIDQNYGSIQNPSFLTYRLPNHVSIPKIEVVLLDSRDPFGPKSLGEIGIVPVAAAIGNAIFNATGVRLREIPFMPEKMLEGIEAIRGH